MGKKSALIVGLDIGTTKICSIVGEANDDGIDIIGIGSHPSRGLKRGVVVNIDNTVQSIKKAIEEAELMAGCEISSVCAGIAGGHIKSLNSRGVIAIKDREVGKSDIERVVDAAKAVAIPMDREVIHIIPQEFIVDDQEGIKQPLGMSGIRLEVKVHIITAAVASAQNIIRCAHRAGLNVSDIILQQLSASEAVLTPDEKDLGVALLDIGGGTTDIAIFTDGSIRHTGVVSLGGDNITSDISIGLRTPVAEAENIKKRHGCAYSSLIEKDQKIEIVDVGGRKKREESRGFLCQIIEPRVEEIMELAQTEIIHSGFGDHLTAGIVFTGGTANLEGIVDLAEKVFNLPVRRGIPAGVGGLVDIISNPIYATGVGLVLHGLRSQDGSRFRIRNGDIFHKVRFSMQQWLKGIRDYF